MVVQGKYGFKMKQLPFMAVICSVMLFIVYRTTNYQYLQTKASCYHCMGILGLLGTSEIRYFFEYFSNKSHGIKFGH